MQIKKLLIAFLFVSAGVLTGKDVFGTKIFDGGRVEPVSLNMIGSTNEHMNFCFATNFPDGTIYINHSEGIHTVSEYQVRRFSPDNGKTWQVNTTKFGGFNAFLTKDGKKRQIGGWDRSMKDVHMATIHTLNDDGVTLTTVKTPVKFPYKHTFHMHREVLRLKNGRLLMNCYGFKEGQSKRQSMVLESKDEGMNWEFLSVIMDDPKGETQEGAGETCMVELKNGDILAYVRTGGASPLYQMRSTDGGRTWGEKTMVDKIGVAPAARLLADGTLVMVTGRPDVYLYIDFTGTGRNYQRYTVWRGSSSSYASVLEIEPNKVMVIYDESDFGAWRNGSKFSRMMAATYRIVKDDSLIAKKSTHKEAANCQVFYSPENKQTPFYNRMFTGANILTKDKGMPNGTWWEIQEIAERPHPVLHLVFKGEKDPLKFSHFYTTNFERCSEFDIRWELRIGDQGIKTPQFRVVAKMEKNTCSTYVACAKDGIHVSDNGKNVVIPFDASTKFNSYVLKTNADSKTFQLFVNGSDKPIYSGKMTHANKANNYIQFGDGSNSVYGEVDLSYFGYTAK